jgi:hypothetical protein
LLSKIIQLDRWNLNFAGPRFCFTALPLVTHNEIQTAIPRPWSKKVRCPDSL